MGLCPADTNAVEWKNQDSKDKIPQQLQGAMIDQSLQSRQVHACAQNS